MAQVINNETVAELREHLSNEPTNLNTTGWISLQERLKALGPRAEKGFDLGLVAVGILCGYRQAIVERDTVEPKPFMFGTFDPAGLYEGFKIGIEILGEHVGLVTNQARLTLPTEEEIVCAQYPFSETPLWLSAQVVVPTKRDFETYEIDIRSEVAHIFRIFDENDVDL